MMAYQEIDHQEVCDYNLSVRYVRYHEVWVLQRTFVND